MFYAGGGGGGSILGDGEGGLGGGGSADNNGTANTGGGGGGRGAGGSGIVIARYLGPAFASGGTVTTGTGLATGYTVHTFTATGSSSFDLPDLNTRLAATVSGNLSGTGGLRFTGPGALTLSGSNSYAGPTTVSSGTLVAATRNALPGYTAAGRVVFGGGTLRVPLDGVAWTAAEVEALAGNATKTSGGLALDVSSGSQALPNGISGSISLTKLGGGLLSLAGSNSYTGLTTVSAGTLSIGDGGTAGSVAGNVANGSVLVFNRSDSVTYSGTISGSGAVTQLGAGTLTLTGSNSFTGPTRVTAGTLALGSTQALAASTLDLAAGDAGVVALTAPGTATYSLGGLQGSRNLSIGNNSLSIGAGGASTTYSGAIDGSGGLIKAGAGVFSLTGSSSYTGPTMVSAGTLSLGNGGTSGWIPGDVTVAGGATLAFNRSDASNYSGAISGTGAVTKTNAGTLTLTGSSSYTGITTLAGGTLAVGSSGALGSTSTISFTGGALRFTAGNTTDYSPRFSTAANQVYRVDTNGQDVVFAAPLTSSGGSLTKLGAGTLTLTGSSSYAGGTTISTGTLDIGAGGTTGVITGNVVNNAALRFNRSDASSFGGSISGTGSLTKLGAGTLTLTGSNSFTGATRVVSGTLLVSSTSALAGSTLDLAAGDAGTAALQSGLERVNFGGLQGSRNLALASQALWVGGNNTSTVYAGQFTGFGSLVKTGSGMLTLTGNSTFSGLTTVSGGTLSIGDGGTTGAIPGNLVTNAETVFNRSDNVTYAGNIQGSGTITKQGPGTLTLTNGNNFGGTLLLGGTLALGTQRPVGAIGGIGLSTITFRGGTLRWETADESQTGGFAFGNDYSPRFSTAANQAYSIDTNGRSVNFSAGLSSAGGSLTKLGAGTLTLSASNSYTGVTRVAAGTLELGNTQALAGSTLDLAAGDLGVVEFRVFENSGTNTYALGGLQGSRSLAIGPNTLSIGGNGISTTYAGSLSGSGGLTKTGIGTLTLTGSSSYSGNTTVNGGTLTLAGGMLGPGTGGTPRIYVGRDSGRTGVLTVESGTIAQGTVAASLTVGDSGTGTFNQTGGSVTLGNEGFWLGNNPGGVGTANFSGGTFTGTSAITVVATRQQGTINVSGSANVTLATLSMGLAAGAPNTTSTVNLDGGRLTVDRVIRDTGTASFFFNGGTLAARGNNTSFMTGLSRAEVRSGGAVIDTGTFAITIGQSLLSSTSSPGGGLTKRGAGTLTLSGSSSYTGGTVVSAGTLSITNSNALGTSGTVVLGNAATGSSGVTLRSTVDLARDITVSTSGSGVARIEGDTNFITYSGGLALNRPTTLGGTAADRYGVSGRISGPVGTLTIDAPRVTFEQTAANANTFTGSVAINPGRILQLNTVNALSGSHAVAANGALYLVVGTGSTATIGTLSGTGLVSPHPSVAGLQTLSVGGDNGSGTFGGSLANGGGTLALLKAGSGTQTLSGSNSYTGSTTVSAGTLITTSAAALPGSTTAGRIVFNGGTLQVPLDGAAWTAAQVNTLLANATKTAGAIGLDVASGSQTLAGGIGGGIGLTKRGPGTLALSASSSYTGPTLVSAGTLALGSAGSISASPAVAVETGAVFDVSAKAGGYAVPSGQTLSGNGTVAGSVTLGAGATLSPGASPGLITVTGNATLGAAGNYNWQVFDAAGTAGAAVGWDLLSVGGVLDVAATSADPFKVNLWSLSGISPDVSGNAANWNATTSGTWRIASATGGITNFSADKFQLVTGAANGTGGFSNSLSGGTFSLAQSGNDLNLVFTAAPPPVITITVASGSQTQADAGFPTLSGTLPLTKTGLGTLVLDQANPLTGPTTVAQGTLVLGNAGALASSAVTVAAGATLAVGPTVAAVVPSLANNGLVDVGLGSLTIAAGQGPATLVAAIVAGRNDGTWDGTSGITSSAAATQGERAVGWLDNGDGSFTVGYAAAGDWNVNGTVDFDDVVQFVSAGLFDTGLPATWAEGDYDYSGTVDFDDVLAQSAAGLFDAGPYNEWYAAMAPLGGIAPLALGDDPALGAGEFAAVPEPDTWMLVAIGIGCAIAGRRNSRPRPRTP